MLLTDLPKAYDCLPYDLLITKLHTYGCDLPSLKLLNCQLRNRRQHVKINNFYGSWAEILFGVPRGSILGPILFNIFLCTTQPVMLTTHHPTKRGNSVYVIHNLKVLGNTLLNQFNDSSMKANPGKYHLLLSGNDSNKIIIGNEIISSSKREKTFRNQNSQ